MSKKRKIRPLARIRYRHFAGVARVRSLRGTALFHRTDYHEDGSKSQFYGIEVSKSQYKRLKKDLPLI